MTNRRLSCSAARSLVFGIAVLSLTACARTVRDTGSGGSGGSSFGSAGGGGSATPGSGGGSGATATGGSTAGMGGVPGTGGLTGSGGTTGVAGTNGAAETTGAAGARRHDRYGGYQRRCGDHRRRGARRHDRYGRYQRRCGAGRHVRHRRHDWRRRPRRYHRLGWQHGSRGEHACQHGQVAGNEVLIVGDSYFPAAGSALPNELRRLAGGANYRDVSVGGTKMAAIAASYTRNRTPPPKVVIMDGGGNDILQNPGCAPGCAQHVQAVTDARNFFRTMRRMAASNMSYRSSTTTCQR